MPIDTAEMKDTAQTGTATAAPGPEHHQTQAAAGSPQAGGAPTANATGGRTPSTAATSGTSTSATAGSQTASTGGSSPGMTRRGGSYLSPFSMLGDPFGMMRSMMDQMDRLLGDFTGGLGRSRQSGLSAPASSAGMAPSQGFWYPQVEVAERGGNLVVRADLPGMRKEDVHLEIHDDFLVLRGERRQEQEQTEGGLYRSERSYGQFYRTVPLPQGANLDQARANFKDGVLEVTVPLPQQEERQGRRIEIQ